MIVNTGLMSGILQNNLLPTIKDIDKLDYSVKEFDDSGFTVDELDNTPIILTLKKDGG